MNCDGNNGVRGNRTPVAVLEHRGDVALPSSRVGSGFALSLSFTGGGNAKLESIGSTVRVGRGEVLFAEGELPRGVYVIRSGRLKLTTVSARGKSVMVHVAEPGSIVGLPETISGRPNEATGQATAVLEALFIRRLAFLRLLRVDSEFCLQVATELSELCHSNYSAIRSLGLPGLAMQRFARFIQEWAQRNGKGSGMARFGFTHEEVGEALGMSRETVSRLVGELRRNGVIELTGWMLFVKDWEELARLAER